MKRVTAIYGDHKYWEGRRDQIDMSSFDLGQQGMKEQGAFKIKIVKAPDNGTTGGAVGVVSTGQPANYKSFTVVYSDGSEEQVGSADLVAKFPTLKRHWNRFKQRTIPKAKAVVDRMLR